MSLQCGIVGLPNVGKSTLFNALTQSGIPAENYPFCTIDSHLGIVELPDERLYNLGKIYNPTRITPATVEFIDIAGLVKGASRGEGLGNQFLGQIRQTSAIIHVVRCFEDDNISHVDKLVDPVRDLETINTELLLADLSTLERRKEKIEKIMRTGDKNSENMLEVIESLLKNCSDGIPARYTIFDENLEVLKKSLHLLTNKPVLHVANVGENDILNDRDNDHVLSLKNHVSIHSEKVLSLCGSIEQEISLLNKNEKGPFLIEYNLNEPGLNKIIKESFNLLKLHNFFTCGEKEVRSWTIPYESTAPEAAGNIHSDIQRGFIKADIFNYADIIKHGNEKILKNRGLIRQEGKDYIIEDGDCVFFKFNV